MSDLTESPPAIPMRVLVVDDERINRLVMEAMLRKMGYEPILANGGQEGLALCANIIPIWC